MAHFLFAQDFPDFRCCSFPSVILLSFIICAIQLWICRFKGSTFLNFYFGDWRWIPQLQILIHFASFHKLLNTSWCLLTSIAAWFIWKKIYAMQLWICRFKGSIFLNFYFGDWRWVPPLQILIHFVFFHKLLITSWCLLASNIAWFIGKDWLREGD